MHLTSSSFLLLVICLTMMLTNTISRIDATGQVINSFMNYPSGENKFIEADGYFFNGKPQHPPPDSKDLSSIAPNDLTGLPKDTEINSLEKVESFVKWLKGKAAAIGEDVKMTLEYSPPDKNKMKTYFPSSSNQTHDQQQNGSLNLKLANASSSSPCEPNVGSFINVRFHAKRLIEPNEMFTAIPMSLAFDMRTFCGDFDPQKNISDFCSLSQWIRRDRRNRFYANYTEKYYDSDVKASTHDHRMLIALFLTFVKFIDEPRRAKYLNSSSSFDFQPFVDVLRNHPDVPVCSFTQQDLEFFPFKDQIMESRMEIWEFYDYLVSRALPKFPNIFGSSKKRIEKIFTYERFAWGYCHTLMNARSIPGHDVPGLLPPIDFMPKRRTLTFPSPSFSKELQLIGLKSDNYIDKDEEIFFSDFDRDINYPNQFIERNSMETEEHLACAVVELPNNISHDPLASECLTEIMRMFDALHFIYSRNDLKQLMATQACLRPRDMTALVRKMEDLNVYNKTNCTVDGMHREHFQKRTPRTKFLAAQYLSLIVRAQMKKSGAKLGRMEALLRKRREGELMSDEEQEKVALAPHFDRIHEYVTHQNKLLSRIQSMLSTMMKESKPEFEVWQKTLAEKKREKEEAELIRKGLKKLEEEDEEDDEEE